MQSLATIIEQAEEKLTPLERSNLIEYERQVEASKIAIADRFKILGEALKEIRDQRLYRESFPTFEAYVHARFKISARRAYQFIDTANIDTLVFGWAEKEANGGDGLSDRGKRALAKESPNDQRAVVKKLKAKTNGGPVTEKDIKEVIAEVKSTARGGLAAAAVEEKNRIENEEAEKNKCETRFTKLDLEPQPLAKINGGDLSKTEVQDIIREWWLENRLKLLTYPTAPTDQIVQKIIDLFA